MNLIPVSNHRIREIKWKLDKLSIMEICSTILRKSEIEASLVLEFLLKVFILRYFKNERYILFFC